MATRYTLYFFGHPSDFCPELAPESETPPANRLPYIFITVNPRCGLPMDVDAGQDSSLPIRLESIKPSAEDPDHILEISGKIYCPHDTRIYDPAGYDFTGRFDIMGRSGSLEFAYRQMLPEAPPRPDLGLCYRCRKPLDKYPYSSEPQRGVPITKDVLPF